MSPASKGRKSSPTGLTEEERAALRETLRERRARPRVGKEDGERDVVEKIATMQPSDRAMAERVHALVREHAPSLVPRTWYGMPAYSTPDGQVLCFFQDAQKFKTRYATLGFSDAARLDDGRMWPTGFALTAMTPTEEARIVALLKKAVG